MSLIESLHYNLSKAYAKIGNQDSAQYHLNESNRLELSIKTNQNNAVNKSYSEVVREHRELQKSNFQYLRIGLILIGIFAVLLYSLNRRKQKLKLKAEEELSSQAVQLQHMQKKINDSFQEIIQLARENHPNFYVRFQECYPNFEPILLNQKQNIQQSEFELLAYIYLNFQTKEIAAYTFRSVKTIQNRKHLLRKKFEVPTTMDMHVWLRRLVDNEANATQQ